MRGEVGVKGDMRRNRNAEIKRIGSRNGRCDGAGRGWTVRELIDGGDDSLLASSSSCYGSRFWVVAIKANLEVTGDLIRLGVDLLEGESSKLLVRPRKFDDPSKLSLSLWMVIYSILK